MSATTTRTSTVRRRRRLVGTLGVLALLVGLSAGAIGAVVLVLSWLDHPAALTESCTAGGQTLDPDQAANAALITGIAVQRDLPARAGTIALATAMQESKLRNIDYGDRDSLGLFQQRPSQGWGSAEQVMDPVYATGIFFDHLVQVPGYTELPVTEAAQAVQRSAFPDAYAQHETMAREFASALTGWSTAQLTCTLVPASEVAATADPAGVAAAASAVMSRDLGLVGELRERGDGTSELVLDAHGLGEEVDRLAWAVAQSAVASSRETGVGVVAVGTWVWERESGAWRTLEPGEAAPAPGEVILGA